MKKVLNFRLWKRNPNVDSISGNTCAYHFNTLFENNRIAQQMIIIFFLDGAVVGFTGNK